MKNTRTLSPGKVTDPSYLSLEFLLAQDRILVGILFLLTLLSRLPFQSHILYHWDSVNFSYAIQEFDISKGQPHPPGYIVYVWLSKLVNLLVHDAQVTLVSISIVSSVLAVVALFYLGRSMFDRYTGLIAALFLASSPLFWFYGEIALPHVFDTLLVIVMVWWLYETSQGNNRFLYPAVAIAAIAGGARQQTLVFLLPMLLFALRGIGWRRFLYAALLGALICLGWFVPLIVLSGGLTGYLSVVESFTYSFQDSTSVFMNGGWWGIRRNLIKLSMYTAYAWSFAFVPASIYAAARLWRYSWPRNWHKPTFLFLWVAPSLFFYTLIHMGQQGLVFIFLPALLLCSAYALKQLLARRPYWLAAATAVLVTVNVGIFMLMPEYPLGAGSSVRLLTRATLINSDNYYRDRFEAIRQHFAPASTVIIADNWHHLSYYLSDYTVLPFSLGSKWEKNAGLPLSDAIESEFIDPADLGLHLDAQGHIYIVIFDPYLESFNQSLTPTRSLQLPRSNQLQYMMLGQDEKIRISFDSFGLLNGQ